MLSGDDDALEQLIFLYRVKKKRNVEKIVNEISQHKLYIYFIRDLYVCSLKIKIWKLIRLIPSTCPSQNITMRNIKIPSIVIYIHDYI